MDKAKGMLRAEIKRRNLNYEDLANKLAEMGVEDNARNLSNKIARGAFTAGWRQSVFIRYGCMKAEGR